MKKCIPMIIMLGCLVYSPSYAIDSPKPGPVASPSGVTYQAHDGSVATVSSGVSPLAGVPTAGTINRALIQALDGDIRWTALSGVSPTRNSGFLLEENDYFPLESYSEVLWFRWIPDKGSASGATVQQMFEKD